MVGGAGGLDRANELALDDVEPDAGLTPLNALEVIDWDYAFTSHSARGHPLAPLREELGKQRLPDAATIRTLRNGSRPRYAGLVICRQRPGTAKGVVHLVAEKLWAPDIHIAPSETKSRDFTKSEGTSSRKNSVVGCVKSSEVMP